MLLLLSLNDCRLIEEFKEWSSKDLEWVSCIIVPVVRRYDSVTLNLNSKLCLVNGPFDKTDKTCIYSLSLLFVGIWRALNCVCKPIYLLSIIIMQTYFIFNMHKTCIKNKRSRSFVFQMIALIKAPLERIHNWYDGIYVPVSSWYDVVFVSFWILPIYGEV